MYALNKKRLREAWHARAQVMAIAMVVASGIATYIISASTVDSLQLTQTRFYQQTHFADLFCVLRRAPESVARDIEYVPGVRAVQTGINANALVRLPDNDASITASIVSMPDDGPGLLNKVHLTQGRMPLAYSDDEVLVSEAFAEANNIHDNATIGVVLNGRLQWFKIVGTGLSAEYINQIKPGDMFPDYKHHVIIWMRRSPLAKAYDLESAFNYLAVSVYNPQALDAVQERVDALLRPYGSSGSYPRKYQLSHHYLSQEIEQIDTMATVLPIIFLGVAAFLINIVMTRMIASQREQIALLKAFGYRNWQVGVHYFELGLIIAALGAAMGIAAGIWLANGLVQAYSQFFRFPETLYTLEISIVIQAVLICLAAVLAGTLKSVYGAVKLPPAEAMRPEAPARFRRTLVERLGMQNKLSVTSKMILRQLERRPLKSALTMLGIAMACAILILGNFQEDAMSHMVEVVFKRAQHENMMVTYTHPLAESASYELASIPGVSYVEPFRYVGMTLKHGHRSYRTGVFGFVSKPILHKVLDQSLQPLSVPEHGLMLTRYLAKLLGIEVGDVVTVELQDGTQRKLDLSVTALSDEFVGLGAYMEIGALNKLLPEAGVASGAYLLADHGHTQAVYQALRDRPQIATVSIKTHALDSFTETFSETILVFAFVNFILAMSIAFGVIYNSLRIAYAERSRELASLRVPGYRQGEVAYVLLGEQALILFVSLPIGLSMGVLFCQSLVLAMSNELYRIPLIIENSTFSFAALVIVFSGVTSAALVNIQLRRMDLVNSLKIRE